MTDRVVEDYREAMASIAINVDKHPEEREGWVRAFFIGHAAGFLTEFKGDHPGLLRVRLPAHEKLVSFIAESPDATALETIRAGLSILRKEYEGAKKELPELQWDQALVANLEIMANESPIVNEAVAAETLRYTGIEA